jgi:type III pantothenate kinase
LLLVIDAGNTNTSIGIFKGKELVEHWRLMSRVHTSDEIGIYLLNLLSNSSIEPSEIDGAILSSVVPPLDSAFCEGIESYFGVQCLRVNHKMDLGIEIKYLVPHEVGADRLVNSVAGVHKYGKPLIVVDFGTAVTLDVISEDGAYLGGTISAGIESGMDALFGKTAQLPKVGFEEPESVIGRTTMDSIKAGIIYGNVGLVDYLVKLAWKELGYKTAVIATGGHAGNIAGLSETIDTADPYITLEGLRIIYDRNCR